MIPVPFAVDEWKVAVRLLPKTGSTPAAGKVQQLAYWPADSLRLREASGVVLDTSHPIWHGAGVRWWAN